MWAVLNVPEWDLGLPTESSQEMVHEVHEVTFMLPQEPPYEHIPSVPTSAWP